MLIPDAVLLGWRRDCPRYSGWRKTDGNYFFVSSLFWRYERSKSRKLLPQKELVFISRGVHSPSNLNLLMWLNFSEWKQSKKVSVVFCRTGGYWVIAEIFRSALDNSGEALARTRSKTIIWLNSCLKLSSSRRDNNWVPCRQFCDVHGKV